MLATPPSLDAEPPIEAREDLGEEDEEEDSYDREVIIFARLLRTSYLALHDITLNSFLLLYNITRIHVILLFSPSHL